MFYNTNTNLITRGSRDGSYNFSMEKSEYLPVLSSLGSDSIHDFFVGQTGYRRFGSHIKINPYYAHNVDDYSTEPAVARQELENLKPLFYGLIERMPELKFRLMEERVHNFSQGGWTKELQNISYHRFRYGKGKQIVDNTMFEMRTRSMGLFGAKDSGEIDMFYVLTFKTKYIRELQEALYLGRPFNNKWFTLFLNPTTPAITKDGKFTKAFSKHFIDPFEEKGIETRFENDILEEISFSEVAPPFSFQFLAKGREAGIAERMGLLSDFFETRANQLVMQADWDMGKQSYTRALDQLATYKRDSEIRVFSQYLDLNYYSNITRQEGMLRSLFINDKLQLQVFDGSDWIKSEDYTGYRLDVTMFFTTTEIISGRITLDKLDDVTIGERFELYPGDNTRDYVENSYYSDDIGTGDILRVSNYTVNRYNVGNMPTFYPDIMNTGDGNASKYSDQGFYTNSFGICTINFDHIKFTTNSYMNVILSSDYSIKKDEIPDHNLVYFVDEDNLYIKRYNLLFHLNVQVTTAIQEVVEYISAKTFMGEGMLIAFLNNKIAAQNVFNGASISHLVRTNSDHMPDLTPPTDWQISTGTTVINPDGSSNVMTFTGDASSLSVGDVGGVTADGGSFQGMSGDVGQSFIRPGDTRIGDGHGALEMYNGTSWERIASAGLVQTILGSDRDIDTPTQAEIEAADAVIPHQETDQEYFIRTGEGIDAANAEIAHGQARHEDLAQDQADQAEAALAERDTNEEQVEAVGTEMFSRPISPEDAFPAVTVGEQSLGPIEIHPNALEGISMPSDEPVSDEPDGSIFDAPSSSRDTPVLPPIGATTTVDGETQVFTDQGWVNGDSIPLDELDSMIENMPEDES